MKRIAIAALILVGCLDCSAMDLEGFLDVLAKVETPNGELTGDGGLAKGRYSIHYLYWKDAVSFTPSIGGIYNDCLNYQYSRRVVKSYFKKYGAKYLKNRDWISLSRIHCGGPEGVAKESTFKYAIKVRAEIKKMEK